MLSFKKKYVNWTIGSFCWVLAGVFFGVVFAPLNVFAFNWDIIDNEVTPVPNNSSINFGQGGSSVPILTPGSPVSVGIYLGGFTSGNGQTRFTILKNAGSTLVCQSDIYNSTDLHLFSVNYIHFTGCPVLSQLGGGGFGYYMLTAWSGNGGYTDDWVIGRSTPDVTKDYLTMSSTLFVPPVQTNTRIVSFQVLQTSPTIELYSHLYYNASDTLLHYVVQGYSITSGKFFDSLFINATTTGDWYDTQNFFPPNTATSTADFDSVTITGAILQSALATSTYSTIDATSTVLFLSTGGTAPNIPNFIATSTCSILSGEGILGCFRNAIVWAVYPTQSVLDLYTGDGGLGQQLTEKSPVGYFVLVKNSILGFSTSSAPIFFFKIPEEIQNDIFNPLKISLASFLWIFFLIHFYKRLKELHLW